jgi:RNA polymerase sigma-70 factor (sigma-E family)
VLRVVVRDRPGWVSQDGETVRDTGPEASAVIGPAPGPEVTSPAGRPSQPAEFAEYVAARLPSLLRFGYALTGNPHDANDLVQDALERVGVRWASIGRDGQNPDAYVRRVMVNARTSRWRRRRSETLVAEVPDTGVRTRDRFDDEPLWQALRELPPRQRAVIVLRYYENLSEAEIAATMGISTGTVKSQAARAMTALRQRLGQDDSMLRGGNR